MAKKAKKTALRPTGKETDPAGLALLARGAAAELARRLRAVRAEVLGLLLEPALLGLRAEAALTVNAGLDPFRQGPELVAAFRRKVQEIIHKHLMGKIPGGLGRPARYWWQRFTEAARSKGFRDATFALGGAIASQVGSLGASASSAVSGALLAVERQVGSLLAFGGRLAARITSALTDQLSKARGTPAAAGRGVAAAVAAFAGWQARRWGRHELQSEYASGQLEAFREAGVAEVRLQAEFTTAGDGKVCRACQARVGQVYTLEEAEGIIPLHIGCRCIWLAVLVAGPLSG